MKKNVCILIIIAFLTNTFGLPPAAHAQEFRLPAPGVRVGLSPDFNPPILKGIKVHPNNPFRFDFILDKGDNNKNQRQPGDMALAVSPSTLPSELGLTSKAPQGNNQNDDRELRVEATRLIKYFLASLTIPEKDLWVNLSPYEKDRIIPPSFGQTEMGRDLLAEDYMLKQITASLIYPEGKIGRKFWKRIYEEAAKKFGTTNIPVNTFNKVWIVPEKAVVYENVKAGTAYIVESKLKVMLEKDYLSLSKHGLPTRGHLRQDQRKVSPSTLPSEQTSEGESTPGKPPTAAPEIATLGSKIIREIVIPELTKEVNQDKNFSQLRQVYNSLILATWYKKKIKDSILEQVYANKNKIAGVGYKNSINIEAIYQRYLQAFKKGAYNYIKEETDPLTQEVIPRKYFSGGVDFAMAGNTTMKGIDGAMKVTKAISALREIFNSFKPKRLVEVEGNFEPSGVPLNVAEEHASPSNKKEGAVRKYIEDLTLDEKTLEGRSSHTWVYFPQENPDIVVKVLRPLNFDGPHNSLDSWVKYFDFLKSEMGLVLPPFVYATKVQLNIRAKDGSIRQEIRPLVIIQKRLAEVGLDEASPFMHDLFVNHNYGWWYQDKITYFQIGKDTSTGRMYLMDLASPYSFHYDSPVSKSLRHVPVSDPINLGQYEEISAKLPQGKQDQAMSAQEMIGKLDNQKILYGGEKYTVQADLQSEGSDTVFVSLNKDGVEYSNVFSFKVQQDGIYELKTLPGNGEIRDALRFGLAKSFYVLLHQQLPVGAVVEKIVTNEETMLHFHPVHSWQMDGNNYFVLNNKGKLQFINGNSKEWEVVNEVQDESRQITLPVALRKIPTGESLYEAGFRNLKLVYHAKGQDKEADLKALRKILKSERPPQQAAGKSPSLGLIGKRPSERVGNRRPTRLENKIFLKNGPSQEEPAVYVIRVQKTADNAKPALDRAMQSDEKRINELWPLGKIDPDKSAYINAATLIDRLRSKKLTWERIQKMLTDYFGAIYNKSAHNFHDFHLVDQGIRIFLQIEGRVEGSKDSLGVDTINAAITIVEMILKDPKKSHTVWGMFKRKLIPKKKMDKAMNVQKERTGGIDLTPANMNIQTKIDSSPAARNDKGMNTRNDAGGIKFHLDHAMLQQLKNAPGFVPVIVNIQPMTDLKKFLGVIVNQT